MCAIVVSGPPASGKTILAQRLSARLGLPWFSRDAIKERLFDVLGVKDREWSAQLGAASYEAFFSVAESLFAARQKCILESNFTPRAAATLQQAAGNHGVSLLQIFCTADLAVLKERFEQRALSGERHPGHVDAGRIAATDASLFSAAAGPLNLPGPLIVVDTTDFARVDAAALARKVGAHLGLLPPINLPDERCVFCQIVRGTVPASVVHQDELTLAFIDLRQFHPGHALVVPRAHLRDVRELDPATGAALMATAARIARAVSRAFPNEGLSLWHSVGPAAFQEVPHLHIHVHPRLPGDDFLRVYPGEPPTSDQQTRDRYAAMVRAQLAA